MRRRAKNDENCGPIPIRKRSVRCLIVIGALAIAFAALLNSEKRFAVDIRVVDNQDQRLIDDAAAAIDQQAAAAAWQNFQAQPPSYNQRQPSFAGGGDITPPQRAPPQPPHSFAQPPPAPAPLARSPSRAQDSADSELEALRRFNNVASPGMLGGNAEVLGGKAKAPKGATAPNGAGAMPKASCEYTKTDTGSQGSRPGIPCIPPAQRWPYTGTTPWRQELGDRIIEAVAGHLRDTECHRFNTFSEYTLCDSAMGGAGTVAISSGNENTDHWSSTVGRTYGVPAQFFNCFLLEQEGDASSDNGESYELIQTCLGPEEGFFDGREYTGIAQALQDHGPLSVHLRIRTEVSGWSTIETLLDHSELMGKLRTLDIDFAFANRASFDSDWSGLGEQELLERQVEVLEELLNFFHVAGSNVEVYRQGWRPEIDCPQQTCNEPSIYTSGGFPPTRLAVSLVSKNLAVPGQTPAARPAAVPGAAAAPRPAPKPAPRPPRPGVGAGHSMEYLAGSLYPRRDDCKYELPNQVSSRPGPPCIPPAKIWPYVTTTDWRTELGERIVAAATPAITSDQCDGWHMFGDQTWCNKAMTREDAVGLSFGIEERDLYSEYLSNHYHFPTKLFDCFIELEKSPPMAKTAPNAEGSCEGVSAHCYETKYESYQICLGPKTDTIDGREYLNLAGHLAGAGPLSTHVKIDVEGSEWTVLEDLIASDVDQAKIRTLDMEIHFGFHAASEASFEHLSEKDRILREIKIIEGLNRKFAVTGSTLEVYRQGWFPEKDCPVQQCHEPIVHTAGGFSPQMFAISFVNREILKLGDGAVAAGGAPHPQAGLPRPGAGAGGNCKYQHSNQMGSRPGAPCIPAVDSQYPSNTAWRATLGDRIVAAATPDAAEAACGGWQSFGDQTWCARAMSDSQSIGITFGVDQNDRDYFTEYLSNHYKMSTRIYDCQADPRIVAVFGNSVPNGSGRCSTEGDDPSPCYSTRYEAFKICLGTQVFTVAGRRYETLAQALHGQPSRSLHIKMDLGGSEFEVIESLMQSLVEVDKIRTLDIQLHFGANTDQGGSEQDQLERQVRALESLKSKFAVTGSTLEVNRQMQKACRGTACVEPVVHTSGGFGVDSFSVSLVSRALLGGGAGGGGAAAHAPAPAPKPRSRGEKPEIEQLLPPGDKMLTCRYERPQAQSSRPGAPCMPPAKWWPYAKNTPWRTELGERILRAVTPFPWITEQACGGWELFGDQTWCKKAFGRKDVMGFSFGIEERDMYSEYLSNNFGIPTRLFDCFQRPEDSPPLSGTAPNATGPCRGGGHCYETPYWSFALCLGPEKMVDNDRRSYDNLHNHLAGYGELSTHVKIDVEGSEWTVLEQLIANDEDQMKIRTLDMEIHFGFQAASEKAYRSWSEQQRITREITIIEGLLRKFYVTGTTLEVYRQGWLPEQDCATRLCGEPVVHLQGGFSPQMFAISFVNKAIVFPNGEHAAEDRQLLAQIMAGGSAPAQEDGAPVAQYPGRAVVQLGPPVTKYGFYLHVYNAPAAVIHQVRQLKKFFPGSPIYLMSDGGFDFTGLCQAEGCIFQLCPPANDRWHPWPFLHRLYEGAKALNTEYVIMLEPDNTIHGPITRHPTADAGGLPVRERKFNYREVSEKLAQTKNPGFKWTDRMMTAGLAGGAYFKTDVILDAFSDESVADFDWNDVAEHATKEIYSSDFAMQYLLAARGYTMEPWDDCAQMDRDPEKVFSGAQDAAFRHYCGCYPGGKPTYNLQVEGPDYKLFKDPLPKHSAENSNCQICYYLDKYKKDWGSTVCTNPYHVSYSRKIISTYFPDGKVPKMR